MILERTPTPLVFVEPGTARLFFANAAADRMAGGTLPRPGSAAEYPTLFDMRDVSGRPFCVDEIPLVRAARGEQLTGFELRWYFPGGGSKVLLTHSARLAAVDGHPETVMVAFEDVTALKETQSELEEAVRVRQDFLSIAGHELKTPLTSLLLSVHAVDQALSRRREPGAPEATTSVLEGDGRLAERWRGLQRQIGRLNGLIDRLLDVSLIAAGKLRLEREWLDLAEVAREVAGRYGGSADAARLILEARDPIAGYWDRMRIEQVITNLVSNAMKYGQGQPVTVTAQRDGTDAHITVRDRGIGIAPDAVSRIFDRFERAASVRHYGGLGLGLWIVRQLVETMGGSVTVETALERGSTFMVRLPVCDSQPPDQDGQ